MELTYYYNNKIMKQHLQQQQHNDQMTNAITANNKPTYYEITTTTTTTTRRRKRTHRNILPINVIIVIVVIINGSLVSPSYGFQQISSLVTTRPLLLPLLPNTKHRSLFHQRTTTITTSGTTNNNNYLITTTSLFQSLSSPLGGTSSYLSSLSQQQQQHYGFNDKTLIDNKNNNNNNNSDNDIFGGPLTKLSNSNDDDNNNESSSFLSQMSVPIFAAIPPSSSSSPPPLPKKHQPQQPIRRGLDGIIPHAFLLSHTLSPSQCQTMKTTIDNLDDNDPFVTYNAGKNHHDALQIVVTPDVAQSVFATIYPYVDPASLPTNAIPCGINRRWRVYRYAPSDDGEEEGQHRFAPHIDAGFPGSGLSQDGKRLVWDDYEGRMNIVSRMTVLLYLNDDFDGGETIFYAPLGDDDDSTTPLRVVAAVAPERGAALIFPQAVGEEEVEYARRYWPLHEGSPVRRGAAKYVIRTDLLCQTVVKADGDEKTEEDDNRERDDVLFRYDDEVSITFNPSSSSSSKSPYFLAHISSLYQPHMGVENLGPFLYSFIRFVKSRTIVEIGAGYTTLFILRALFDNDEEMGRIGDLMKRGRCRLLDVEWTVEEEVEKWETTTTKKSKLLCVDDCLHQKQTAGSVVSMAKCWGYDNYLDFRQGNVFEMDWGKDILGDDDDDDDETRRKTIDLLWCDFGVGDRLSDFIRKAWRYITPGGYFVCHSTVTNSRTREWLEAVRNSKQAGGDYRSESVTGLPPGEYVELSLWEHHKRFQNSITILQKRPRGFEEPVYSEYA